MAVRFWDHLKGGIVEHVLDIEEAEDRSANGLRDIVNKKALEKHGISLKDGLVSNCFDGANVMSGDRGKGTSKCMV